MNGIYSIILILAINNECGGFVSYVGINKNLTAIPYNISSTVQGIYLGENNFETIPDNAFSNYTALKVLDLSNCQIENISSLAFRGTRLSSLRLENNNLAVFPNLTVIQSSLIELYLDSNTILKVNSPSIWGEYLSGFVKLEILSLKYLELDVFPNISGLTSTLITLKLVGNRLQTIEPEVFLGQSSLTSLNLRSNGLRVFPDFSLLPPNNSISELQMGGNDIQEVTTEMLQNLPALRILDLSNNRMTKIGNLTPVAATLDALFLKGNQIALLPSEGLVLQLMLEKMHALTSLALDKNLLTSFPNVTRTNLDYLGLENNPLVCDCHIAWIKDLAATSRNVALSSKPCVKPVMLSDQAWGDIVEEDLVCLENITTTDAESTIKPELTTVEALNTNLEATVRVAHRQKILDLENCPEDVCTKCGTFVFVNSNGEVSIDEDLSCGGNITVHSLLLSFRAIGGSENIQGVICEVQLLADEN